MSPIHKFIDKHFWKICVGIVIFWIVIIVWAIVMAIRLVPSAELLFDSVINYLNKGGC